MHDQTDQTDALRARCAAVRFPLGDVEREELKTRVHLFVDQAKATGSAPERVVIAVKQPLIDTLPAAVNGAAREVLLDEIVTWCIKRYYAKPGNA